MRATVKSTNKPKPAPIRSASSFRRRSEEPEGLWERISSKAYELWEQRGRLEGNALRNWLDAEEIVMEEFHEARE